MVGKKSGYLEMRSEQVTKDLISSDMQELVVAAKKLLPVGLRTERIGELIFLQGLLIPYIFFSLPSLIFNIFRGEIGRWIAFIAVVLRLFFPSRFPDWLEMPGALILLIVVAPSLFASTLRGSWIGVAICLVIACYLLQEHIRASGGFRNSFTRANGISNSVGIIILLVYPAWALITDFI
ncbi:hypothetical protein Patl1_36298 [Pistacia atlantica]|nr:hypothetical protein Patl1_36298 [Pistacia atlantica]